MLVINELPSQIEKTTLKRLDAGEKLPDITGAPAMIREKMAPR